jgi:flagellar capping protein FliD
MENENLNPGQEATGGQTGTNSPETSFTKERVNELMRKRVERSHQAFFTRYGVKDLNELDELFGKAGSVDQMKSQIEELTSKHTELENRYKEMTKKYAFSSRNIKPDKYADIETYFKGKGLEINEDTLNEELKGHSDWINQTGSVVSLGQEQSHSEGPSEKERASKLLGVDL